MHLLLVGNCYYLNLPVLLRSLQVKFVELEMSSRGSICCFVRLGINFNRFAAVREWGERRLFWQAACVKHDHYLWVSITLQAP